MQLIGFYIGLLALIYLWLCLTIVKLRYKHKVKLGDGDVAPLQQAIRAQANFIEYVPLCLLMIMTLSTQINNDWVIHISVVVLIVARLLHALGLHKTSSSSFGRFWGTILTWLSLFILALSNIALFLIS